MPLDVAQGLLQGCDALFPQLLLGNDGNRLRYVLNRARKHGESRVAILRVGVALALDFQRTQLDRVRRGCFKIPPPLQTQLTFC